VLADATLIELVEAVRELAYGRPTERSVEAMWREGRGTCSLKHLFLAEELGRRFPATRPRIVHRVNRLDRDRAAGLFGEQAAATVPDGGLVDVHRYLTIELDGTRIAIDATFAGPRWDGKSSLPLACGPGEDIPAGPAPEAEKLQLEDEHCDPAVREPFIAALARAGPRSIF
jgi:hypothetical protein